MFPPALLVFLLVFLLLILLAPGCATSLDHQAELLLHPDPIVQGGALIGAAPGVLLGAPIWGPTALITGSDSDAAAYALHLFAYPGALLLAGAPWLLTGPSYEQPISTASP